MTSPLTSSGVWSVWLGGVGLVGALTLAAEVKAQEGIPRLDGQLRALVEQASRHRMARGTHEDTLVRCYVQAHDASAARLRIIELGGGVATVAQDVLTATVPVAALPRLAADTNVLRIESGAHVQPRLDRVREVVNVSSVHNGLEPFSGRYRGAGVIVGVVDLSLDVSHAAFKVGHQSRVIALWDQAIPGESPTGFGYGSVCSGNDVLERRCFTYVGSDHGTHVTGIAAGGQVGAKPYFGLAPEADIVFVNLSGEPDEGQSFEEWMSTSVCDGVAFIFRVAEERGQPAVVNLSVGSHTGPHDGTSLESACIDNLTGPGRIVVAAAGNEGEPWIHYLHDEPVYVHASGEATGSPLRAHFVPGDYVSEGEVIDVWFEDTADDPRMRVGVKLSDGSEAIADTVNLGDASYEVTLTDGDYDLGPIVVTTDRTPSGSANFRVRLHDENNDFAEIERRWFIELEDTGHFDAFLDVTGGGGFFDVSAAVVADSRMSIGYPAVARNVIAVGSSVSRNQWTTSEGVQQEASHFYTGLPLVLGALSSFSSRGPTRDPEHTGVKPDVVAPGEMVVSAMANPLATDVPLAAVVQEEPDGYFVSAGTSQASPVVTGLIALMLERNPTLDPDEVRALLRESSQAPDGATLPNDDWGSGLVDAAAVVAATPELNQGKPPPQLSSGKGCGCRTPRTTETGGVGWLGVVAGLGLTLWRRSTKRRHASSRPRFLPGFR